MLVDLIPSSPTVAVIITIGVVAAPVLQAYNGWAQRREARRQAKVLETAAELVAAKVEEARKFNEAVANAVGDFQKNTDVKLDTIHNLVDGNMSEAKATIKDLRGKLDDMEKLLGRVVPLHGH